MGGHFALTDCQKRFIFDYLQSLNHKEVTVLDWERIAEQISLKAEFGQLVKAAYDLYLKDMEKNYNELKQQMPYESQSTNEKQDEGKEVRVRKEDEVATDTEGEEFLGFQTQAQGPSVDEETEEDETGEEIEPKEMKEQSKEGTLEVENKEPEKDQTEPPKQNAESEETAKETEKPRVKFHEPQQNIVNPQKEKKVLESVENTSQQSIMKPVKETTRKRKKKSKYTSEKLYDHEKGGSFENLPHVENILAGRKLEILGMKQNYPGGIIWKVMDQDGKEYWVENRFMKYFYPDVLFQYYEEHLVVQD